MSSIIKSGTALMVFNLLVLCPLSSIRAQELSLSLRYQQETGLNSGRFHRLERQEEWKPEETAIIVCDVWDYHHCLNAVRRLEEFVPRLNDVLDSARQRGVVIVHAPSDCMPAYENHPARQRALKTPVAEFVPFDNKAWCSVIPAEERAQYPIDQSDGGEDDDPTEHTEWAARLKALGRNPGMPWKKQSDMIRINKELDYISDRGDEVWNVLEQRGIKNVILMGVHTNMCVLGRPFGLRQMARHGKNVVLMRDMTDTMYNPRRWPFVSHFTGTDLIVSHIERFVCPTITSDQIIGGKPFQFKHDQRPHLVMLIAEDEYKTERTLPAYAVSHLGRDFRVTQVFGSDQIRHSFPGIETVRDADVLLISIRRRVLPAAHMELVRDFVAAGKPVVGVRTASHAFSLGGTKQPPDGFADWPEFDAQVFGGNYHGHHRNGLTSLVDSHDAPPHDILDNVPRGPRPQGGSLYKTTPLAAQTTVLSTGVVEGETAEPVTWTFERPDGGRSFYTSMGHPEDFTNPVFTQLLYQGICWAAGVTPTPMPETTEGRVWQITKVPLTNGISGQRSAPTWFRCAFRIPLARVDNAVSLHVASSENCEAYVNGTRLTAQAGSTTFPISTEIRQADDANLLVLKVEGKDLNAVRTAPELIIGSEKDRLSLKLDGKWQTVTGNDEGFANIPLPAKFGAGADIVYTVDEPLWIARPITRSGDFTSGIEGPACDEEGHVLAVNYGQRGTIGRVAPNGSSEIFVRLPEGSVGNGIRFDNEGNFYVADYPKHNVLKISTQTRKITTLAHDDRMNQPNDLAMAPDGTLYASDPNWRDSTGQLWRIDGDGTTTLLASNMGTTNGIEVSPNGKVLYVNESAQRNIWAFDLTPARTLTNKRLIRQFPDHGFDGMRCDIDGNLYVTRYGEGTIIKMSPDGDTLQTINVLGAKPSNLCFGGPDGRTVYVTEVENTRLVAFRVDRPGRSWVERQH